MTTRTSQARRSRRLHVPPQHGAWAFLLVPLVTAATLGAATWVGLLFAVTWVLAYPTSYFGSRAVMTRLRRHEWSRMATRERSYAMPWAILFGVAALTLIALRPWIVIPGVVVGIIWSASAVLTWKGRERGIANDLILVVLSALAAPLMWAAAVDQFDLPASLWWAAGICAAFFTGSVLHVKSLIREAGDRRWKIASMAYAVVLAVVAPFVSWWLLPAFAGGAVRAFVLRPGLRPGAIGAVEAVLSVLVVAGVWLSFR